jgi:hypothetical protein
MVHMAACEKTVTAEGVARLFEANVFKLHGISQDIESDRDPRFVSEFWTARHERLGTKLNSAPSEDGRPDRESQRHP